jgi:hypothetical protein
LGAPWKTSQKFLFSLSFAEALEASRTAIAIMDTIPVVFVRLKVMIIPFGGLFLLEFMNEQDVDFKVVYRLEWGVFYTFVK